MTVKNNGYLLVVLTGLVFSVCLPENANANCWTSVGYEACTTRDEAFDKMQVWYSGHIPGCAFLKDDEIHKVVLGYVSVGWSPDGNGNYICTEETVCAGGIRYTTACSDPTDPCCINPDDKCCKDPDDPCCGTPPDQCCLR